jgi:hypothetical protein
MKLTFKGEVMRFEVEREGVGKYGKAWCIYSILVQPDEGSKLAVKMFDNQLAEPIQVGQQIYIECDVESREWNGKYYTNANVTSYEVLSDPEPEEDEYIALGLIDRQDIEQQRENLDVSGKQVTLEYDDDLPF